MKVNQLFKKKILLGSSGLNYRIKICIKNIFRLEDYITECLENANYSEVITFFLLLEKCVVT